MLKIGALNQSRDGIPLPLERFTLAGFTIYFVAALAYVISLRRIPLTVAFPSVSLSYFFVSYAAHLTLGESFTSSNIFALVLISSGIFILAASG